MPLQRTNVASSLRVLFLVMFLFLLVSVSSADSLELRDGRHLHGKYLGGTSTAVSFMADGVVQNLPVSDVLLLVFGEGSIEAPLGASTTGSRPRQGSLRDVAHSKYKGSVLRSAAPERSNARSLFVASASGDKKLQTTRSAKGARPQLEQAACRHCGISRNLRIGSNSEIE